MLSCHGCDAPLGEGDRFCAGCGTPVPAAEEEAAHDPLIGRVIGSGYVIRELIGVGGMGRVYRAEQRMLGRKVAIKVIHPSLLGDEQSVARFHTEARASSRLNHPNTVSIIDFGRTDDGILYLVMEHLGGKDLTRLMHEQGPLPFARICDIMSHVLAALSEAHALGVVHRDLKPENVIVEQLRTGGDLVKVLDFGLAKLLAGEQAATDITTPGLVCGTPDYMAPEQARGEETDGRADIYSAGVLLFELLTERLPFVADSPTKVVLKQIQAEVPNVQEVAPHRGIPDVLVHVTNKALQKDPRDRYQSAQDMAAELRLAAGSLRPPGTREVLCPGCGKRSGANKRFCGECGTALGGSAQASAPRVSLLPPSGVRSGIDVRPFVGRQSELMQVASQRDSIPGGACRRVDVVGEPGVGKTRLLLELAGRFAHDGDLVVGSGPEPSGAPGPYGAIRPLLWRLDLQAESLQQTVQQEARHEPAVLAGLRELAEPRGLVGPTIRPRAAAVARLLGWAVERALARSRQRRAVLMVDDLQRCDGLSGAVLRDLPGMCPKVSLLLMTATTKLDDPWRPADAVVVPLTGLTTAEAQAMLGGRLSSDAASSSDGGARWVPLLVEQLAALGVDLGSADRPEGVADAVAQRVQRLDLASRRLLQAASVFGDRCARDALQYLATTTDLSPLEALGHAGLLSVDEDHVSMPHPLVRELVETSIPAEARKELHLRALDWYNEHDGSVEVRAHHAYGAGESLTALMLLERAGDLAASRGDAYSAAASFQRGLELARRQLLETGDASFDGAIATFSRKLGAALSQAGQPAGGEGVMREALELAAPASMHRLRMLLALGDAVTKRRRFRDARRWLSQALEIASSLGDIEARASVQLALARLGHAESGAAAATAAYRQALALLEHDGDGTAWLSASIEAMTVLLEASELDEARRLFERAEPRIAGTDREELAAQLRMLQGELLEAGGSAAAASRAFAEAERLATRAGDLDTARRVAELAGAQPGPAALEPRTG